MPTRPAKCLREEGVKVESNSAVLRPPITKDETGALLGQTMGPYTVGWTYPDEVNGLLLEFISAGISLATA